MMTQCGVSHNNLRMRRRHGRLIRLNAIGFGAVLGLAVVARSGGADTVDWTGGASGNWNVAANWTDTTTSTNKVPGSTDDVDIVSAIVSLVGSPFTIQDLTLDTSGLSGGMLTVTGNATLTGANSFANATITVNGSVTQTGGSLLINGSTLTTPTLSLNNGVLLDLQNNPTLAVTNIVFGNTGGDTTPGSLQLEGNGGNPSPYTIGVGTTLSGNLGGIGTVAQIDGNASQLTNDGTINLANNRTVTTLGGGNLNSFINAGVITISNGATLAPTSSFPITNNGTFTVGSGGTLALNGSTTLTGASPYTVNASGTVAAINTNTLLNATVNVNTGGSFAQTGGILVDNGSTLNGTFSINNGAILDLYNNPTLTTVNIVFGNTGGDTNPGSLQLEGSGGNPSPYTIGAGTTISGNLGGIGTAAQLDGNASQLTNDGTINLANNGTVTTLGGGNLNSFINAGVITISNGATLTPAMGANAVTNNGTFTVGSGGTLALNGGQTLTGASPYTINASGTVAAINTNTLLNATVNVNTGGSFAQTSGILVDNGSTLNGTFSINNGAILDLYNNPTLTTVNIVFGNTGGDTNPGSLQLEGSGGNPSPYTIGTGTTISGNLGGIGTAPQFDGNASQLTNNGTITLNTSGVNTTLGGGNLNSFINAGVITISNGATLTAAMGANAVTNNATFTVDAGGTLALNGGQTLTGSSPYTINASGTVAAINTNTLLNATVNVNTGGSFAQTGGVLVDNGSTLNGTFSFNNGAILDLYNNPTLTTANIVFGNTGGDTTPGSLQLEGSGGNPSPYTIGAGTTISGNLGGIGTAPQFDGNASQLTNNGTITLSTSGLTTTLGGNLNSFTNGGTLQASNGNTLTVNPAFTNSGIFSVGTATTATLNSGLTQTGGTTLVNGSVTIAGGQNLDVQGGQLAGNGTVTGTVTNSGGTVHPGDSTAATTTGTLQLIGDFTQGATATTLIDLGGTGPGTSYSQLHVSNSATLSGTLDVKLVGGFTPTLGETFDFLTYGTRIGSYSSVVSLNNGFFYTLSYSNDGTAAGFGILTVAVPETSTLLSSALMLSTGGLLLTRRERRRRQEKRIA